MYVSAGASLASVLVPGAPPPTVGQTNPATGWTHGAESRSRPPLARKAQSSPSTKTLSTDSERISPAGAIATGAFRSRRSINPALASAPGNISIL